MSPPSESLASLFAMLGLSRAMTMSIRSLDAATGLLETLI
jgi:hypothetical protein